MGLDDDIIDKEIKYFETIEPCLLMRGLKGRYIAIHNQMIYAISNSGEERGKLVKRIYDELGMIPVLIREIGGDNTEKYLPFPVKAD